MHCAVVASVPGWCNKWTKEQWKHRTHPYKQATRSTAEPFVSFVLIRTGECPGNKIGNWSLTVTSVRYRCMRAHKQTQKPVAWRLIHVKHQSVECGLAHRAWCQRKSFSESIYNPCVWDIWCPLASSIRCWQCLRDGWRSLGAHEKVWER